MMFFWLLSSAFGFAGLAGGIRYLILRAQGDGAGHVQSVILTGACITACLSLFILGFLADLVSTNRRLMEKIDWRVRCLEKKVAERPTPPDQG